jgi:hypothetical protein
LLLIPQIPPNLGVYLLSLANVIGAILGPIVNKFIAIRPLLIGGQFVMSIFLGMIVLFSLIDIPIMILVSMIFMITTYQISIGSYYFVYVS